MAGKLWPITTITLDTPPPTPPTTTTTAAATSKTTITITSTSPPTTTPTDPLSSMTKLSPTIYTFLPTPDLLPPPPGHPKLILLAAWMDAADPHISKYINPYRDLFPSSAILLLRPRARHFFVPKATAAEVVLAIPFIRSIFPTSQHQQEKDGKPQVLIHVFSNGGSSLLVHLRRALLASDPSFTLPSHTTLFDSAPGNFSWRASKLALTAALPRGWLWRLLGWPVVRLLCAWFWVKNFVLKRNGDPLARAAATHNDTGVVKAEVRRTYVYCKEDQLVLWRDVEGHADVAEKLGYVVRKELFEGSDHVAHARKDAVRYWKIARETWEGRGEER